MTRAVDGSEPREDLAEANARLRESNEELMRFAYVVSHDLQAPLRQVVAFCDLLEHRLDANLDPEARTWLRGAITASNRMQVLIRDLLAYSRVAHDEADAHRVDADHVLYEVLSDLTTEIADADATITAERLPEVVAPRHHVRQLLQNLLSNALVHRAERPPHIRVGVKREDGFWRFKVADNGPGIDDEQRERVFEVFSRLHPKKRADGTGIGLAICRRIVARLGGRIWIDPTPGGGCTFCFTLPAAPERGRAGASTGGQSDQAESHPPAASTDSRKPA